MTQITKKKQNTMRRKNTIQRAGMTELNILKQTSIRNIFLYRTVFNWGKENNARLVTDRQTDRQTQTEQFVVR